jgi:hypothetical protein
MAAMGFSGTLSSFPFPNPFLKHPLHGIRFDIEMDGQVFQGHCLVFGKISPYI